MCAVKIDLNQKEIRSQIDVMLCLTFIAISIYTSWTQINYDLDMFQQLATQLAYLNVMRRAKPVKISQLHCSFPFTFFGFSKGTSIMDFTKLVTLWIVCLCFLGECRGEKPGQTQADQQQVDNELSGK